MSESSSSRALRWAALSPQGKAAQALRLRQYRKEHPERNRQKNIVWRKCNAEKHAAHKAVEKAIRKGQIERQPCERCGAVAGVHAHHDDYAAPLAVRWLCPTHHKARHRELSASGVTP